jgi:hypothetical protein
MGATVTTGKRAAGFRRADGEFVYALFERSYDINTYPHQDSWSAFAFGLYEEVIAIVFSRAQSCENGMRQSRAGSIKPENYIEAWKRELSKPVRLRDREISLYLGDATDAPIPAGYAEDVRRHLFGAGLGDSYDAIRDGGVVVSLYCDTALLLALYGVRGPLNVWQLFTTDDFETLPMKRTEKQGPKPSVIPIPDFACYSVDGECRLLSIGNEPLRNAGWTYQAVRTFIGDVAYPGEIKSPGFAKKAIPWFRELIRNASPLPPDTRITVTREGSGAGTWQIQAADRLAVGLGIVAAGEEASETFSFVFSAIGEENARSKIHGLCSLCSGQVRCEPPQKSEVMPGSDENEASCGSQQLALVLL